MDFDFQKNSLETEGYLAQLLLNGEFGDRVVDLILPDGQLHSYECEIWDYKREFPKIPGEKGEDKNQNEAEICEFIKDIASFHNSYGGYILIGIDESDDNFHLNEIILDIGVLNDKLSSYLSSVPVVRYYSFRRTRHGKSIPLGLVFIQKRDTSSPVVKFKKNAKGEFGKRAFNKNDVYGRFKDKCRPASDVDDYQFLLGDRVFGSNLSKSFSYLDNNLPPKDPDLVKFVGRREQISSLWEWVADDLDPIRFLTGFGGLGKTSLAYEFCLQLVQNAPANLDKLVWLTGKEQAFSAITGKYHATRRTDFKDVESFLRTFLLELGTPIEKIDVDWDRHDLLIEVGAALDHFSILLVVDDVDGIGDLVQQSDLVATISSLITQAFARNRRGKTRVLFTSRLEINAGPMQIMKVSGLERGDFYNHVMNTSSHSDVHFNWVETSKLFKKFYSISQGSPLFASAIIRLVAMGDNISNSIDRFEGEDGEDVRKFAFERELQQLSETQAKILYAVMLLGQTNFIELKEALELGSKRLLDELSVLRQFHLLTSDGNPDSGVVLSCPASLAPMSDIVGNYCIKENDVKLRCARIKNIGKDFDNKTAIVISTAMSLIRSGKQEAAIQYLESGMAEIGKRSDLLCMMGRTYMSMVPPRPSQADRYFKDAYERKCERPELYGFWMKAKTLLEDWRGVTQVSDSTPEHLNRGELVIMRLKAISELADQAVDRSDAAAVEMLSFEGLRYGVKVIDERRAMGFMQEILRTMSSLSSVYLGSIYERVQDNPRSYLDLFNGSVDVFQCGVKRSDFVFVSCKSIVEWWGAVEAVGSYDQRAADLAKSSLRKLGAMKKQLQEDGGMVKSLQLVEDSEAKLYSSLQKYTA